MNRQEAIQQQIDEIMDAFDFQSVLRVMDVYKSMGSSYPTNWILDDEFYEPIIRSAARECMKQAAIHGSSGHSYFSSYLHEGEDADGPWVKIELFFGDRTYNDGTTYEKTITTIGQPSN